MPAHGTPCYPEAGLHALCVRILRRLDVPADEAATTADALLYADVRGIDTHGLQQLAHYVDFLRAGAYHARREMRVVAERPASATLDAGGGLGHPAGAHAMRLAMAKAAAAGIGVVAVRNSHHFSAAGYYASLALDAGMIGIAITNGGPNVLPTGSVVAQVGSNPIAIAVPAGAQPPFVLDMATSVRAAGRLQMAARAGEEVPAGLFMLRDGSMGRDPLDYLDGARGRRGGLLPLGGAGEAAGGYKGFGLSLAVELLAPVLAGEIASPFMHGWPAGQEPPIAHLCMAIDVAAFRPAAEFGADVDRTLAAVKGSELAPGASRVWVAGEKEAECLAERRACGIPLDPSVVAELRRIAGELGVDASPL